MESKSLNTAIRWANLRRVLEEFGDYFVRSYRHHLEERGINASGNLSKSLQYTIKSGATFLAVDVSLLEYWKKIEYGQKPLENKLNGDFITRIEDWVTVKKIVPYANNGRVPSIHELAYLIARKIVYLGTQPRPIFATSLDEAVAEFEEAIEEAVTQDIAEIVDIELLTL